MSSIILGQALKAEVSVRIAHSHTSNAKHSFLEGIVRRYLKSGINSVVTHRFGCSREALYWLFGSNTKAEKVIANGVILDNYLIKPQEPVDNHSNGLLIGHVGSFRKVKNHDFIIEVFKEVLALKPSAELILIGNGPLRSKMERKVEELGISSNVNFLGIRSDIPELLSQISLFIMPSLYEGLPLTLIEAQAAGKNCLITDTITNEADVGCGLIHRMSLNHPPKEWANKAVEVYENKKLVDSHPYIKAAGFDIADTSQWIEEFYLKEDQQYSLLS